jgi:hypothetical protein
LERVDGLFPYLPIERKDLDVDNAMQTDLIPLLDTHHEI